MGRETKIAWADHTFNGVRGCEHATLADGTESPGCEHCYAESMSKRNPRYLGEWGPEGTRVLGGPDYWANLEKWHRAAAAAGELRRVFCYSLGDVFESPKSLVNADICRNGRALLWDAIERLRPVDVRPDAPWRSGLVRLGPLDKAGLIFLLLTKRPENVKRMVPASWLVIGALSGSRLGWPQHVWLGTSVENQQAADERIPRLLDVSGPPVRFLSIEPLLERINLRRCEVAHGIACDPLFVDDDSFGLGRMRHIDWLIVGGESGHRARPCDVEWIRDLRDQARAAGVPFFNKQAGAFAVEDSTTPGFTKRRVLLRHPKGEDPEEWSEDLRVREIPEVRL